MSSIQLLRLCANGNTLNAGQKTEIYALACKRIHLYAYERMLEYKRTRIQIANVSKLRIKWRTYYIFMYNFAILEIKQTNNATLAGDL